MGEFLTTEALSAFLQVIMIDLVLAGDNAVVIGLAAAGLPKEQRNKAILIGIIAATVLRIVFALPHHPASPDRRPAARRRHPAALGVLEDVARAARRAMPRRTWKPTRPWRIATSTPTARSPSTRRARPSRRRPGRSSSPTCRCRSTTCWPWRARRSDHPVVLVFGLALSIALMGIAASFIARLLQKHRWIAYVGLAVILYVARRDDLSRRPRGLAEGGDAVIGPARIMPGSAELRSSGCRACPVTPALQRGYWASGRWVWPYLERGAAFAGVTAASTVGRRALRGAQVSWASLV